MPFLFDNDKGDISVAGNEYVATKLKTKTLFTMNDSIINATNTLAVFVIPSLPGNSHTEISGVILFKFASGNDNGISFTVNPSTGIGNTAVGFTVHKMAVGAEALSINTAAPLVNSATDIDPNIHAVRYSGILHNPGGGPINNFQLIVKNQNLVGQGVALTVLARSFITYQVL